MKITPFEECIKIYADIPDRNIDDEALAERAEKMASFPFSVVTEGTYPEIDIAEAWIEKQVGKIDAAWIKQWYWKIDYDYGFMEYFFVDEANATLFANNVPWFYGEVMPGKKWKTYGAGNFIDL